MCGAFSDLRRVTLQLANLRGVISDLHRVTSQLARGVLLTDLPTCAVLFRLVPSYFPSCAWCFPTCTELLLSNLRGVTSDLRRITVRLVRGDFRLAPSYFPTCAGCFPTCAEFPFNLRGVVSDLHRNTFQLARDDSRLASSYFPTCAGPFATCAGFLPKYPTCAGCFPTCPESLSNLRGVFSYLCRVAFQFAQVVFRLASSNLLQVGRPPPKVGK